MKRYFLVLFTALIAWCCNDVTTTVMWEEDTVEDSLSISKPSIVVLGTFQDAGSPHIACKKDCCAGLFDYPDPNRKVVSLGVVDPENGTTYLLEATPDIATQLKYLKEVSNSEKELPDGIFLTHAHIGHYSGLMYLGKEATNASEMPVYAMPRMKHFLETNGPWDQLVHNKNIVLHELQHRKEAKILSEISIAPILVPHRDEYSETVGYFLEGPRKKAIFIPDIDKWDRWEIPIVEAISEIDLAFIDATFYDAEEINNRDISEIPHPFIIETMALFDDLEASERNKIHFIHFNHTNPVIDIDSEAYRTVTGKGYNVASIYDVFEL